MVNQRFLHELVVQSIGVPERGVIDFSALQKLLLAIVENISDEDDEDSAESATPMLPHVVRSKTPPDFVKQSKEIQTVYEKGKDLQIESDRLSPEELLNHAKSRQPITEQWQFSAMAKKLEVNDETLSNVLSMIHDIAGELEKLNTASEKKTTRKAEDKNAVHKMEKIEKEHKIMKSKLKTLDGLTKDVRGIMCNLGYKQAEDKSDSSNESDPVQTAPAPSSLIPHISVAKTASTATIGQEADTLSSPFRGSFSQGQGATSKLDEISADIHELKKQIKVFPQPHELVTWTGLADTLNGIRGQFAAFSATPLTGPSDDLLNVLEQVGKVRSNTEGVNNRLHEIESQLSQMIREEGQVSDLTSGEDLIHGQFKQILEDIAAKLADIDQMKAKLMDIDVLLSDIPETTDKAKPKLGDKSRLSITRGASLSTGTLGNADVETTRSSQSAAGSVTRKTSQFNSRKPKISIDEGQHKARVFKESGNNPQQVLKSTKEQNTITTEESSDQNRRRKEGMIYEPKKKKRSPESREKSNRTRKQKLSQTEVASSNTNLARQSKKRLSAKTKNEENEGPPENQTVADDVGSVDKDTMLNGKGSPDKHVSLSPKQSKESQETLETVTFKESEKAPELDANRRMQSVEEDKVDPLKDTHFEDVVQEVSTNEATKGSAKRRKQEVARAKLSPDENQRTSRRKAIMRSREEEGRLHTKRNQKLSTRNMATFGETQTTAIDKRDYTTTTIDVTDHNTQTTPATDMPLIDSNDQQLKIEITARRVSNITGSKRQEFTRDSIRSAPEREQNVSIVTPAQSENELKDTESNELESDDEDLDFSQSESDEELYRIGQDDSRLSTRLSVDTARRYTKTIREVVYSDYIGEVELLQKRLDRLELKMMSLQPRSTLSQSTTEGQVDRELYNEEHDDALESLTKKMFDLSSEMNKRMQNVNEELDGLMDTTYGDADALQKTQIAISDLQTQLEAIRSLTLQLQYDNHEKNKLIQELASQAARLRGEKLDRHVFDAEIDMKAEKVEVDLKVDKVEFETVSHELQAVIEDLLSKLLVLEDAWKRAHQKLEIDMEYKPDLDEVDRLKAYIDRKHKELNSKIKQQQLLASPYAEDAAVFRKMFPFNCLSCDKPVVIKNALSQLPSGDGYDTKTKQCPTDDYTPKELEQIKKQNRKDATELSQISCKNSMKAYLVHFGKELGPKVFITRSKTRLASPDVPDFYSKRRRCGGKHTVTQSKTQGQTIQNNQVMALKDLLSGNTDLLAAGTLITEERMVIGADGRPYKTREDAVEIDNKLTQVLQVNRDPIMPLVDKLKQTRGRGAGKLSTEKYEKLLVRETLTSPGRLN